eukprot:3350663-Rhodomonas_salina.7
MQRNAFFSFTCHAQQSATRSPRSSLTDYASRTAIISLTRNAYHLAPMLAAHANADDGVTEADMEVCS